MNAFYVLGAVLANIGCSLGLSDAPSYTVYNESSGGRGGSKNGMCCLDTPHPQCTCCFSNCSQEGVVGNGSGAGLMGGAPPDMGPPFYMYVYVSVFNAIVFLVGITGNLLVIQAVARSRSMRRRINYFLVCLSVADLLVLVVCLPVALLEFYGKERWYIGEAMCKIVPFLENMSHHCSVLTLLAIGFERYYAICHPLRQTVGQRFTSISVVIPAVWTLSIIVSLPFAILSNIVVTPYYDQSLVDTCRTDMTSRLSRAYIILISLLFLALPLFLLTAMYTAIILTLAGSNNNGLSNGNSAIASTHSSVGSVNMVGIVSKSGRHSRGPDTEMVRHARVMASRRQVVRMMVAVMALYFCCLVPMRCVQLWAVFGPEEDKVRLGFEGYLNLFSCVRILISLNSAGNPIIYGLLSSNFRSAFRQSLVGCKSRRPRDSWRYNTAYYSNSQHQHYLHQHSQAACVRNSPPNVLNKHPLRPLNRRGLEGSQAATSSLPLMDAKRANNEKRPDLGNHGVCTALRMPSKTVSLDQNHDAVCRQNGYGDDPAYV